MLLDALGVLPEACYPPLAHLMRYLDRFGIAGTLLDARFFRNFRDKTHMVLAANTLQSLSIIQNDTDGGTHGSLLSVLDRTKTKYVHGCLSRCVLIFRIDVALGYSKHG